MIRSSIKFARVAKSPGPNINQNAYIYNRHNNFIITRKKTEIRKKNEAKTPFLLTLLLCVNLNQVRGINISTRHDYSLLLPRRTKKKSKTLIYMRVQLTLALSAPSLAALKSPYMATAGVVPIDPCAAHARAALKRAVVCPPKRIDLPRGERRETRIAALS